VTPDPGKVLLAISAALGGQVLPEVKTPFGQQTVGLSAMLLVLLAQDYDRVAARLAEENLAVLGLLRRARALVADPALQERIAALEANAPNADLAVSALERENDALRGVLIDVHAGVESMPGDEAAALNTAIWAELCQSARRRHTELPQG
jgi:hypothetical protein